MPAINSATVTALYLFDVAEQIDLGALRMAIGGAAASAKFTPGRGAPSYLQYANPPLVVDGDVLQLGEFDGFKLRLKFFDYGVLSLALTRPFAGDWPDLVVASQRYIEKNRWKNARKRVAGALSIVSCRRCEAHGNDCWPKTIWCSP